MGKEKVVIMLFDYEGNYLQDFDSISECARFLEISQPQITQCLNGMYLSANSFQFRRRLSNITPARIGSLTNTRSATFIVGKYWNNRLISTYPSISNAADLNSLSAGNISSAILNGWKINGFTFKKLN